MSTHFIFNPDEYAEKDYLGFEQYIGTLKDMITDPDFKTPFCIGVYGKWGSGKTTFMHLLAKELEGCKAEPYVIPVWFNPCRYSKEEHLIIPFLKTIEQTITKYSEKNTSLPATLIKNLKIAAIKMGEVAAAFAYGMKADFKLFGKYGFEFEVAKAVEREEELEKQRAEKTEALAKKMTSIYYDMIEELKKVVKSPDDAEEPSLFRITVFIDDLDRCLPEKAVELLEAVKLFLNIEGYLFVIGVAKEVIARGIAYRYRYLDKSEDGKLEESLVSPEEYLEKMIQLPLDLPPIEPGKKRAYIEFLIGDQPTYKNHADIIEAGVGDNPRALKRFINLLAFISRHADRVLKIEQHNPLLYIKWALIVYEFPLVYNQIKGNQKRLIDLQKLAKGEELPDEEAKTLPMTDKLKKILQKGDTAKDFFPDDEQLIANFVHLTQASEISVSGKEYSLGISQHLQSGAMVKIPKGPFKYGDDKREENIDYDYYMDVFPVTNKQYQEFINECKDWDVPWSKEDWVRPYNWDKEKRTYPADKENHPVVLVSYNDAVEFCKWRTQKEGKNYRLPTGQEWEKAARGNDGREYPWGNEFDKDKCNTTESGIDGTTKVTQYPNGASPYGCQDMAGNVWEWMDSGYGDEQLYKVLRGGSWNYDRVNARCAYRFNYRNSPSFRYDSIGFRCLRIL